MASSSKDVEKRETKRSQMRRSLQSVFGDQLQSFKTPTAIRQISEDLENESTELEARVRKISDSSEEYVGDDLARTSLYIDQRQDLVEDLNAHIQKAREAVNLARVSSSRGQNNELKRALKELDETDSVLLKERAALAADRMRVIYRIHGQPGDVKIGEAYRMAITDHFEDPADASYKRPRQRSPNDQSSFRNRLLKAYQPESSRAIGEPDANAIWCPISRRELDPLLVKAAHIIPYSIGEANAAYLFGTRLDEGHSVIWSAKNGLLLHSYLEKLFDDGRMVIIPDLSEENEFMSVILSQDLLRDERPYPALNAPHSTIHKRRLQFQTAARPGKRYLYVHTLLSLFRRKRFDVPGWEYDAPQVLSGQIWATPGKWARKSMLQALALEFGDTWNGIEVRGLAEFPDKKSPKDEERMATILRYLTGIPANLTEEDYCAVEEEDDMIEEEEDDRIEEEEDDSIEEEDDEHT